MNAKRSHGPTSTAAPSAHPPLYERLRDAGNHQAKRDLACCGRRGTRHHRPVGVILDDDNEDSAVSLKALLELVGHEVQLARSEGAGMRMAGVERPDVVLLDIGVPDMDGDQVAHAVEGTDWGVAALLIATTGWG